MKDFLILSCANKNRFRADVNHKKYADAYSIKSQFSMITHLSNPFFIKPYCIANALEDNYENILSIDDDAFFVDKNWDFRKIFKDYSEDLIVTRGKNKKSGITLFNAGVMFIKNTKAMRTLFSRVTSVTNEELKENWRPEWGPCVGNEQPRLIYLTQTLFPELVKIIDYPGFNTSEIDFHKGIKEKNKRIPPIVHFTGQNKQAKIDRFNRKTNINLF